MTTVREYFNWRENGGGQDCDQDMAGIAACFANHCVNQYSEQLCARITELEAAQTWQPIESAPLDETEILMLTEGGNISLSYWCETSERWCDVWSGDVCDTIMVAWMPLPTPPKEGAA